MSKPFAKKHVKTDKVDARELVQLLRMDYLPESYVPGKEIRDQRVMISSSCESCSLKDFNKEQSARIAGDREGWSS